MPCFWKKIDARMQPLVFFVKDSAVVLEFLAKLKNARNPTRILKSIAVWCSHFFVKGQAETLMLTRLIGSSMAVVLKRSGMSQTYRDEVGFLLQAYATDVVTMEAYKNVVNFRQSFAMTEMIYSRVL